MTLQQVLSNYATDALLALGPVIVALIGFLGVKLTAYVHAHTKNALVTGMIDRLTHEVNVAVTAIEQTMAAALKAKNGGVLTVQDAEALKAKEIAMITSSLGGDKWIAEAQKILGADNIKAYLGSLIDAEVLKLAPAPAAAKA